MRRILTMMLGLLMICSQLLAQNRSISGRITDENNLPVPNASVTIKGSKMGTFTNSDGAFSLSIPANAKTLVISSIGLAQKEIALIGSENYNVSLTATASNLQEVVVVGYGTKSVREVAGAISHISGEKIANEPVSSFNQALAGKTAGVQVNLSTGILADRTAIRVRGINSISSSSQPLIVIDGIPSYSGNLNGFNSGNGTRFDPLSLVNPNDIESIEVLKDAGSAAIYGSRASNGVILITTKKGKKGSIQVTVDSKTSMSSATKLPTLLNGDEFIAISNEKTTNRFGATSPYATPAKESDIDGNGVNDRTDWNKELYRTGLMYDNTVSFRGGADKMTLYGSLRYLNQEGIIYANKLRSGQARMNLEVTPKTWLKTGLRLAYTKSLNNGVLSDTYIAGTTVSGWMAPPTVAVYNPASVTGYNLSAKGLLGLGNNTPIGPSSANLLPSASYYYNVKSALDQNRNDNTATDTRVTGYAEISPVNGLKLTSQYGIVYLSNFEDQFTSPYQAGLGLPYNGLVQDEEQNNNLWNWQNYASYDKAFGSHKISVTAGTEYQKRKYNYYYVGANNFTDPFFKEIIDGAYTNTQPGSTTILNNTGGNNSSNAFISYFGRASYSYAGKYFLEGSFRRDGYSAFGTNHQFGSFPGVTLGWEATKESFLQNVSWLNYLKVRGSWGKTGNSAGLGDYASRTLYGGAQYASLNGLGITQAGNANLQWESAEKTDGGFDATIFKNKLNVTVDYYENNINNLILSAPTLYTVGIPGSSITTNIGGMTNKGFEITLSSTPVNKKDFSWTTSLNYSHISNKVTGLVPSNGNADITAATQVASVGKSLGTYKLPKWAGVDAANGNPMWYSSTGTIKEWNFATQKWNDDKGNVITTGVTSADYVYLDKTGLPSWYGGWQNTFSSHNFDLNVDVIYQGGNYIYNTTKASMLTNFFSNNFAIIKDRWTTPGQVTDVPKLWASDNTATIASTRFLEKGDFARIRSISLGYTVPKKVATKAGFEGARVYVQAFNWFTFTKYSGLDPDVNYNSFNNIAVGTDNRATPPTKALTVGLNLTF
jgi:TonB-dependent starch-binding outer membrane protein SusC